MLAAAKAAAAARNAAQSACTRMSVASAVVARRGVRNLAGSCILYRAAAMACHHHHGNIAGAKAKLESYQQHRSWPLQYNHSTRRSLHNGISQKAYGACAAGMSARKASLINASAWQLLDIVAARLAARGENRGGGGASIEHSITYARNGTYLS